MDYLLKFKNYLLLLLLILIAVQFFVIFPQKITQNENPIEDNSMSLNTSEYNQEMTGVHLVESADSNRDWEMFSKEARGNQESGKWDLGGVKINIYNKNRIEFIVDGDRGAVAGDKQDLQIDGNVQIRSGNGYILTCRSAKYLAKSRELIGEGPIKVFDGDKKAKEKFNLTGSRLKINVPDSKMYVFGPVLARRDLSAEKFITLKSQRAMLSSLSSEVIFSENLEIVYNNFIVHGQEAQLKFQDKDKILQKLYIKGGVKLKDSIRMATADSIEIDFKTQNISLNGNPYVVSGEDEIRGDKIILVEGGKKVIVDKLKAKMEKIEK